VSDSNAVVAAFAAQAAYCRAHGSPFTARLLYCAVEALGRDEPELEPLRRWSGDPRSDVVPLRFAAALHALVLSGSAPALAAVYPPHGDGADDATLWSTARAALSDHPDVLATYLARPPQTNEVGRSAILLGGFLTVVAMLPQPLPLRLLELGASAGLNLRWDRYRYRLGDLAWPGEGVMVGAAAPQLSPEWMGAAPPIVPLRVIERAGCDREPVDIGRDDERLRLRAYVWADQADRLRRPDAALATAATVPAAVDRADADAWIERRLAAPAPGALTVVYHSIFWNYLDAAAQQRITRAIDAAGSRASDAAPLAWLRFELDAAASAARLTLSLWPGPRDRVLAEADAHAHRVIWRATPDIPVGPSPAGPSPTIGRLGEPA
jgi:hypothetical protein